MIGNFTQLYEAANHVRGKRLVVVYPDNEETFEAVRGACGLPLEEIVLVGDKIIISRNLEELVPGSGPKISFIWTSEIHEALRASIALVKGGRGGILMKGGVDTSTMMKAVLQEGSGLRTGRLLSDIFILEFPQRDGNKFVMITDGGMTLSPDLKNKAELIANAVEVAHALGNPNPKVAVLSATEFIVPSLQSTLDAAALSKMNERGQIRGCVVDGPFALDNAISPEAAEEKGIVSPVAGRAEILIAANIESANSLAKSTTYFAGLRLAHVIVGGAVPILIPSRSDKSEAKLLSVALGMIMAGHGNGHDSTTFSQV
jgi:phosphate butyryltransferase